MGWLPVPITLAIFDFPDFRKPLWLARSEILPVEAEGARLIFWGALPENRILGLWCCKEGSCCTIIRAYPCFGTGCGRGGDGHE